MTVARIWCLMCYLLCSMNLSYYYEFCEPVYARSELVVVCFNELVLVCFDELGVVSFHELVIVSFHELVAIRIKLQWIREVDVNV